MMNIQIDQAPLTNQPGEQLKRLEVIFHPFARRRRTEWYQDKPTARFVHYTTAQAALKIITSKRLWMRNATCMADYREVQHGFDNLVRVLFSEPTRGEFVNALERCAPGSATKAMEVFANWRIDAHLSTYITSLSEHNDKDPTMADCRCGAHSVEAIFPE